MSTLSTKVLIHKESFDIILSKGSVSGILSPKGSIISLILKSSQQPDTENEEMTDIPEPMITELREILKVKLPDIFSGNRKELEVFLL